MLLPQNRLNAGWELHKAGQLDQAEDYYRGVIKDYPKNAVAWCYLGMVLNDHGEFNEAVTAYHSALSFRPDMTEAMTNLGNTLSSLGEHQAAIEQNMAAIKVKPDYARAHTNLGIIYLRLQDYETGWTEYEWRLKTSMLADLPDTIPIWKGEDLNNKKILVHGEQGIGDELQSYRYVKALQDLGAIVYFTCQDSLTPLLSQQSSKQGIYKRIDQFPSVDYQIYAMSIPLVMLKKGNMFCADKYIDSKVSAGDVWTDFMQMFDGYKVGICWQGNPENPMDRIRSIPASSFNIFQQLPQCDVISLQAKYSESEYRQLRKHINLYDFNIQDRIDNGSFSFTNTATIISNLDLVITCDTSIAHLAGAMHKPTWLLLAKTPDWRWGLESEQTGWYPSMHVFRQANTGDWQPVFKSLYNSLHSILKDKTIVRSTEQIIYDGNFNSLAKARYGPILFNKYDRYIGLSIRKYGEFSEHEIDIFKQFLKQGDTVIDAGANIGSHTIAIAKIIGDSGIVHAFEPQRLIYQTLSANVALNCPYNVICHNTALSDKKGFIKLPTINPEHVRNFGGISLSNQKLGERVTVITIDQLKLERCDFIKADVEGMELEIINGAIKTIKKYKPVIYIENDRQGKSEALITRLFELGYRMFEHKPHLYNENNYYNVSENIFKNTVSANLLCLHSSAKLVLKGFKEISVTQ